MNTASLESTLNPRPKISSALRSNQGNSFRPCPLTLIGEKNSASSAANCAANPPAKKQTARIPSTENAGLMNAKGTACHPSMRELAISGGLGAPVLRVSIVNGFAKMLLAGGSRWRSRRLHSGFNFLHMLFRRLLGAGRRRRRSGVLSLRSSRSRQHRNSGQQGNANHLFHFLFSSFVAAFIFFSPPTSLLCLESRGGAIASIGDSRLRILMKESS